MPLQATSGAASYDAFGGGVPVVPNYIEEVFSTFLYSGTNASQTITNNIDLSGKGGLVWQKQRTTAIAHRLFDTVQTLGNELASNSTSAVTNAGNLTAFSSTGFTVASSISDVGETYVTWTFRKQPKFFDVVTYTGNGVAGREIPHNLGSVPGCVTIKKTSGVSSWNLWHRSISTGDYNGNETLFLNTTAASSNLGNQAGPFTSTTVTVGEGRNASGDTYVMYLWAHDAGGFGLTGTDNVISCGSFTTDGSGNASVTLGYEPQFVMWKKSSAAGAWNMQDVMRGMPVTGDGQFLEANASDAEYGASQPIRPNATGFYGALTSNASSTYIYIAIRRGPMKVPTSGTSVFSPVARTGNSPTVTSITSVGFPPDAVWQKRRSPDGAGSNFFDRLRGRRFLSTATTATETAANTSATRDLVSFDMTGFTVGEQFSSEINANTKPEVYWAIKRAPSFFDEVCYTNNASGASEQVNNHNLGVIPELAITKVRNDVASWYVASNIGSTTFDRTFLDLSSVAVNVDYVSASTYKGFTSTTFTVGSSAVVGAGGFNVVTYLFATCAGVSKVGSYTGTATTKQIDCGFTSGARFVLIKRTDSTGDWYVWDTARGIVSGNDPYLLLNSTAVEVTSTDYIDTYSAGFEISSTAPAAINASGGSFIFLAIA